MKVFNTISFFTVIVGVLLLVTFEHLSHDTGTKYGFAALYRAHLSPPKSPWEEFKTNLGIN